MGDNLDRDILLYQLTMQAELMKLWDCDLQRFAELEKHYDLFPWIRANYEYLQGYGDETAAQDIDRYVREKGGVSVKEAEEPC